MGPSWYEEHVLPRCVELTCGTARLNRFRARAMEGMAGAVVELGFGSGSNVGLYPEAVTEVLAVEPSAVARARAARRASHSAVPIRHIGLDGAALPLDDASCDAVLATFTLCTIPDIDAAMAEVRRVLRPGGSLHLLEHGIAPDTSVQRWQRRIEPVQRRVAGGCHLTRDPVAMAEAVGLTVDVVDQRYVAGPKPWCWMTTAVARKAAG